MNKWKIAFFVSIAITILTILGTGYVVLISATASGINYDNLLTVVEDIDNISIAIKSKANTIEEFDRELEKINCGHWTDNENKIIQLQVVKIRFDKNGIFESIDTNQHITN